VAGGVADESRIGLSSLARLGERLVAPRVPVDRVVRVLEEVRLLRYLACGTCGDLPALPDAVAELASRGMVDREQVIERVLEALTTAQRPKSQGVLAQTAQALELKPDEVPGGLTYLLGVLATSHTSVQPVLLPHAIELIADEEGLRQLTNVVVSRPDKGPRTTLLTALKAPPTAAALGAPAVLAALSSLAAGDDAAFTARVERVIAALAPEGERAPRSTEAVSMGLWDLAPSPGAGDGHDGWRGWRKEPTWDDVLDVRDSYAADFQPWLVEVTLRAMANGTFAEGKELLAGVENQLVQQRLSTTLLCRTLDDLFLAGGLREGWPVALLIADRVCGAATRPPGLADLLRTLCRYAAEAPNAVDVPPRIAALALASGSSKAQFEARRLVTGLTRLPEDKSLAALADAAPTPELPSPTGLWKVLNALPDPAPTEVRVGDPDDPLLVAADDLASLRELLSRDFNGYSQSFRDICHRGPGYSTLSSTTGLTEPDRVLAGTLVAIQRHGAVQVRAALAGIERPYQPVDVIAAIDCWIADALDPATFWRVAHGPTIPESELTRRWRDAGQEWNVVRSRHAALPTFAERLRLPDDPETDALVVPSELGTPIERFTFLRAAESLMLTDSPYLAAPTWADGTLDVDVFLARLEAAAESPQRFVGPLDLVQGLHRLRPVHPASAADVPTGLRTAPAFTDPEGKESWDASELVRHWLAEGGLPTLEVGVDAEGRWATSTVTPVPFARLAALPAELAADPWCPGPMPSALRMLPRWADRVTVDAFASWMLYDPRHFPGLAAGPFGLPLHDRLLSLATPDYNTTHFQAQSTLADFARRGRLDPALAAAAAVGRHEAGTLKLSLLVKTLHRLFPVAFREVWPSALAIADALCGVPRKPTQLPDLLRLLTATAHEVPAAGVPELPPTLVALAESRGTTKSHAAARQLVEALRAVRAR
jgi:hypothetical protein